MTPNYNQPPMPPMPQAPRKKKSNGFVIGLCAVIGFFAIALIAQYIVDGPARSDKQVAKFVASLQADSISLNKNLTPLGYNLSHPGDIANAVDKIRSYGDPFRYTPSDSAFYRKDPRTAGLVAYNEAKCAEVLAEVLPMWRSAYALGVEKWYEARTRTEGEDNSVLLVYKPSYLLEENIEKDYSKMRGQLRRLGFKQVVFAMSPTSNSLIYDL